MHPQIWSWEGIGPPNIFDVVTPMIATKGLQMAIGGAFTRTVHGPWNETDFVL